MRDIVVGCSGDNSVHVYLNRSLAALATTAPRLATTGVYPNPATNYLRVATNAIHEPLQATLLEFAGRVIRQTTIVPDDPTLPVADLPRGLYVLRIADESSSSTVRVELQ